MQCTQRHYRNQDQHAAQSRLAFEHWPMRCGLIGCLTMRTCLHGAQSRHDRRARRQIQLGRGHHQVRHQHLSVAHVGIHASCRVRQCCSGGPAGLEGVLHCEREAARSSIAERAADAGGAGSCGRKDVVKQGVACKGLAPQSGNGGG